MRAASELFPKPAVVSHSVELVIDLKKGRRVCIKLIFRRR
jgi:hypothetical protein